MENILPLDHPKARILVLGSGGMVGSAIVRALHQKRIFQVYTPRSRELDLRDHKATLSYFSSAAPTHVFMAAAKVGGILANSEYPLDFLHENLTIQTNVFDCCVRTGVHRLLFLASSCIYPRGCQQPMREDYLMTGPLEETNKSYALAKLCGVQACASVRKQYPGISLVCTPVLPCNLYGPRDNYDPAGSHVIPGMIWRMHKAKVAGADEVALWGSGTPYREFMHANDCAEGCLTIMDRWVSHMPINLGTGVEGPLWELADMIKEIVGFKGEIRWDKSKPDGTPRKRLNNDLALALGWRPRRGLKQGLVDTYLNFLERYA